MFRIVLALLVLAWSGEVGAQPVARVVAKAPGSERFEARPVQARVGEVVELGVRLVRGRRLAPLPEGARVRWLQVVPRMQHLDPPARNKGNRIYSNSIMFGPDHGRWIGPDRIEYETIELKARPGAGLHGATLELSKAQGNDHSGMGTVWIAAEMTLDHGGDETTFRTPDGSSVDALGVVPQVIRVSFRGDDTFLGWLGTFFNVPYVFGSTGPQTDRYTGTDCADAMVGARRASGARGVQYTSVPGLARLARALTPVLVIDEGGTVRTVSGDAVELRWGEHVRPGDLLAMDFTSARAAAMLPRAWDHVAALVDDAGAEAGTADVLDGADAVRHMTTHGLMDEPLSGMGNIRFRLWRWRR